MEHVINSESPVLTPKNWEYPKLSDHVFTFQDKSHEDLPDAMRWADAIDKETVYCGLKGKELATFLEEWKPYTATDDVRVPYAYKSGGKMPENWNAVKKLRVVGKAFIYKVGKHLLSGNFNLTTIPFPIRAMVPKSYLEYVGCTPTAFFPLYMNLALKTSDPVERFKLYIVASLCYYFKTTSFAKPLNPIIGETCTGQYDDGSHFYLEQVSHHPPISYILFIGPNDAYKYYGPSQYAASAGLNSLTVTAKAWRKVTFKDNGQTIHNTIPNEYYDGSLLGQTVHSTIGSMEFTDEANKISCIIELGKVKKKPTDYLEAVITVNGKPVSKLTGTYLGWLEFDGKRYFDWRYTQPFQPELIKSPLHSDFHYRADRALLAKGQYDAAQTEKERLEQIQRTDAKLRKEAKGEATGPANGQTL